MGHPRSEVKIPALSPQRARRQGRGSREMGGHVATRSYERARSSRCVWQHCENSLTGSSWRKRVRGPSTARAASLREAVRFAQDDRGWAVFLPSQVFGCTRANLGGWRPR
jgi:hypothetical protein